MANLLPPAAQIAGNHITTYEGFFQVADVWKTGNIAAADAAAFLKKSGLSDIVLSKIWDLCDPDGKAYLDKRGFFMSLKFIALVQNGHEATLGNLAMSVPPPKLGDVVPVLLNVTGDWRITSTDKVKSDQIFDSLHPVNNKVSGDKVKPVLLNSNLPVEILSSIWDLSDIDKDGHLDRDEFAVAMYLIYRALDKEPVPSALPPDLVPPSKRRRPLGAPQSAVVSVGGNSATAAAAQHSLSSASGAGASSAMPLPAAPGSITGGPWIVPPAEKAKYDARFAVLDTNCDGLVNGLEVKETFMQSGLHQATLAHIWNLCDTHNLGSLNADQFALAMFFIEQKIMRHIDPPQALSADMLTPSMRTPEVAVSSEFAKEMELIEKEIEELKREKIALEADKQQKEADIRIRNGEVQTLQKELDAVAATNQQLERQKAEAQKRLDELDDKKAKCQDIVRDLTERVEEKQRGLKSLQERYSQQERTLKDQEEEAARLRSELSQLADEQRRLELQLEASRQRVDEQRRRQQAELAPQIATVKAQIEKLQNEQAECDRLTAQYTALLNGDPDAKEPADETVSAAALPAFPAVAASPVLGRSVAASSGAAAVAIARPGISLTATAAVSSGSAWGVPASTVQGGIAERDPFGNPAAFENFKEDPFRGSDPFESNASADPFKEDPFKADIFAKDPFQGDDPFKNDPFVKSAAGDPFSTPTKKAELDPFSSGGGFGSRPGSSLSASAPHDAFDPFSSSNQGLKISLGAADPFPSDPFAAGSSSQPVAEATTTFGQSAVSTAPASPRRPGVSGGATTLPPPRPAPPVPGSNAQKKAEQSNAFGFGTADPFGGADPFGSAVSSPSTSDPFAAGPSSKPASRDPFAASGSSEVDPFGGSSARRTANDPFAANFADFTWDVQSSSGTSWPSSDIAAVARKLEQPKPQSGTSSAPRAMRLDSSTGGSGSTPMSPTRIETDI